MKKIFLICAISCIAFNINAQNKSELYDKVADWSRNNEAQSIIDAYNSNTDIVFKGDSLSWFFYYVSHAFIQTGEYETASQLLKKSLAKAQTIQSDDLKIRLMLSSGLILKKQSKYKQSIEQLDQALPLIKKRISVFEEKNQSERLKQELEKLTTLYINKSTAYFYLGDIEKYGDLTKQALQTAIHNNNKRQEFLARRNLIEYYEITEQWAQATEHLNAYSVDIETYGSPVESARYKLRAAIYQRDKLSRPEEAIQMIAEVKHKARELKAFQIWEEALYEILHTYILQGQYQQAIETIEKAKKSDIANSNINTLSLLRARSLQLHIYTKQWEQAEQDYKALQIINTNLSNPRVESVATHAIIMYLTKSNSMYTARLLLHQLLENAQKNQTVNKNSPRNIEYILMQRYTQLKHTGESVLTHEEIIDRMLHQYKQNDINEWWLQVKESTSYLNTFFLVLLMGAVTGGGIYYVKKKSEDDTPLVLSGELGSEEYQALKSRINYI